MISLVGSRLLCGFPKALQPSAVKPCARWFGFSFAGPRSLDEIVKMDLLKDKSVAEVSDIWMTYHENKENVNGVVLSGKKGKTILSRASACPFFIQPIFREEGFFMLVSQFQKPNHFLMAYLEDYKMDPSAAQPLLTFSIFNDLAEDQDVSLVRCDLINKGIHDGEGIAVLNRMLESYKNDDEFAIVENFNQKPDAFDIDNYISCQNQKW
eukprot:CAMPEP_0197833678 /NCGR_PEP_ID=MMETSP1437-20131217/19772_1 /TAXON_ID=49252 ORGANISM="Eucampia antarctica, Strain CCMP1452" /NCGR_SAMPLE_ID=MMETSP1437 /ASSEMBLY_ACC=CAM_ASM_001096 /LENGTH=209 /DNA_ID=CAMNT_0043437869 /DNA_START=33 /DNA_END=659 /DNA_ORIENTATION=+